MANTNIGKLHILKKWSYNGKTYPNSFYEPNYQPKRGDIVFFTWTNQGTNYYTREHVGIVLDYKDGIVYTIEGNSGSNGSSKNVVKSGIEYKKNIGGWRDI